MSSTPPKMTRAQIIERAALRREGEAYASVGLHDRLALVNAELQRLGEPTIAAATGEAGRQVRKSAKAATRTKRAE